MEKHEPGTWGTEGRLLPCGCKSDVYQTVYCSVHFAAPDLLAALERVTLQLAHEHTNDEAWVEARAAIAKATG